MGIMIEVYGEVHSTDPITGEQAEKIRTIKNKWGDTAFDIASGTDIFFTLSNIEGCDPFQDGIMAPLEELMSVADKEGIDLDGCFDISSSWGDYDNILITVRDSSVTFGNSEIVNAATEELVSELHNRHANIYGFTICGTDRCYLRQTEGGNIPQESFTFASFGEREIKDEAYRRYLETFESFDFEGGTDADGDPTLTREEFDNIYPGSVIIQASDEHVSFDFWSQTVPSPKNKD